MIGAIGSKGLSDVIMFEVSDIDNILTFRDFKHTTTARYSVQNVHLKKPVSQFQGPGLDKLEFDIILKAQFGANPKAEFDKLIALQEDGETVSVVIGNSPIGSNRWKILYLGMPWEIIDNKGNCVSSTVSVRFEEYV